MQPLFCSSLISPSFRSKMAAAIVFCCGTVVGMLPSCLYCFMKALCARRNAAASHRAAAAAAADEDEDEDEDEECAGAGDGDRARLPATGDEDEDEDEECSGARK